MLILTVCVIVAVSLAGMLRLLHAADNNQRERSLEVAIPRVMPPTKDGDRSASVVTFLVLAAVGCGVYAFDWNWISSTKITRYSLVCSQGSNGRCPDDGWVQNGRTEYRVDASSQAVVEQTEDSPPRLLEDCAVLDKRNWQCREQSEGVDSDIFLVTRMTNGELSLGIKNTIMATHALPEHLRELVPPYEQTYPRDGIARDVSRWEYLLAKGRQAQTTDGGWTTIDGVRIRKVP